MKADVYVFDLEVFSNCFMCAMKQLQTGKMSVTTVHRANRNWRSDLNDLLDKFQEKGTWFVGYNSMHFDDPVIAWLLGYRDGVNNAKIHNLTSNIQKQATKAVNGSIDNKYKYHDLFRGLDLMKIGALRKSLKMVAVNLKWPLILDFPFDHNHEIQAGELDFLRSYNINDVNITEELYKKLKGELNLRAWITKNYGVNVMNEPRSGVANRLMESFYSKSTNTRVWQVKNMEGTFHSSIDLDDVIFENIKFSTRKMKLFLKDLKTQTIRPDQDSLSNHCLIGKTRYKVGEGGLHSERQPGVFESMDSIKLIDADVSSYYPFTMIHNGIKPAHLSPKFFDIFKKIVYTRINAKKRRNVLRKKDSLTTSEKRELKECETKSDALKLVINAVYGKMGNAHHWLHDQKAMYDVTVNGQLYLLMLIEALERAEFEVFYANTDGITAKVPVEEEELFRKICTKWTEYTEYDLDYDYYSKMVIRDVNNYIAETESGKRKRKGELNKNRHERLGRSFDRPIVPTAAERLLFDNVPIMETLREHGDVYDFCMASKPGSKFDEVIFRTLNSESDRIEEEKKQKSNRYFVGKTPGSLWKRNSNTGKELIFPKTKGVNITLYNDAENDPKTRDDVNLGYYRKEVSKITSPFETEQLDLF